MRGVVMGDGGPELRDDLVLRAPGPGEVVVALRAAGVCHSDLKLVTGATDYPRPVVMGHEGAGVVEAVGAGVTTVAPGDTVVLHTLQSCGRCRACAAGRPTRCVAGFGVVDAPFHSRGAPVHQFANTSAFVERTVVAAGQAVPVDPAIPPASAALLGCGVLTGAGAVLNRARVAVGDTVVVIGAGGVGLNAVQAAALAGAARVIAVDTNPAKEPLARRFGATDTVCGPHAGDAGLLAGAVRDLLGTGADHVLVCIGHPELVATGVDLVVPGGQVIVVGFPGAGVPASFALASLYADKAILACRYGSSNPARDIPMLAGLYRQGRLRLDELVTGTAPLEGAAGALEAMAAGRTEARTVLQIGPAW